MREVINQCLPDKSSPQVFFSGANTLELVSAQDGKVIVLSTGLVTTECRYQSVGQITSHFICNRKEL